MAVFELSEDVKTYIVLVVTQAVTKMCDVQVVMRGEGMAPEEVRGFELGVSMVVREMMVSAGLPDPMIKMKKIVKEREEALKNAH